MILNNEKVKAKTCPVDQKQTKTSDGNNLYLITKNTGSKFWYFIYMFGGKHKDMSLGEYPTISLKLARTKAGKARQLLSDSIDPMAQRKLLKLQSTCKDLNFGEIAFQWFELNKKEWSNAYQEKLLRWLKSDLKGICELQIDHITKNHIINIVSSLVKANTVKKVPPLLSMLNRIFRYAITKDLTNNCPLTNFDYVALTGKISAPKNHAAITNSKELGQLILTIENNNSGSYCSQEALKLLPHLFLRPSELRCLRWEHVDFENKYIKIPGELMKAGKTHIVPLSVQTLSKFQDIYKYTHYSKYVFPSEMNSSKPFSKNVLNNRLRALGYSTNDIVSHGFRGTASTLLNEQEENFQHIEMQLAHKVGNSTTLAYNHAEYLTQRRAMMQRWSNYLNKLCSDAELCNAIEQSD
ncbi:site-specific integrase [Pseudoalteromonas sp. Z9A5]|uniref:tyrosine-type recombinase/integrase n=1 Tax=Pseudoalteromonas sp. Z9A5 TaxID=2686355 RepID=UPI00140B4D42|nr:site-specific integrase [Pseudoalteromonas sp. Z9A5]